MLPRDSFRNHGIHETSLRIHYSFRLHFIYLLYIDISDKNLGNSILPSEVWKEKSVFFLTLEINSIWKQWALPYVRWASSRSAHTERQRPIKSQWKRQPKLAARCGLALTILWSNNQFIYTPFTTLSWLWFLLHFFLVWVQQRCWNENDHHFKKCLNFMQH